MMPVQRGKEATLETSARVSVDAEAEVMLDGIAEGSLGLIDASTGVLARVPSDLVLEVVRRWADCLAPGGRVVVAVPDFTAVAKAYIAATADPETALAARGGCRSLWNRGKLVEQLALGGLDLCCGVEDRVSLTVGEFCIAAIFEKATRPPVPVPMSDTVGIISLPRFGITQTMIELQAATVALGINVHQSAGAFWGHGMQRLLESAVADGRKYALTFDYDSAFTSNDIVRLRQIMDSHPEISALCPVQVGRGRESILANLLTPEGERTTTFDRDWLARPFVPIDTGHFGCTFIRIEHLERVPKPWFAATPDKDGGWGEGHTDEDIHFWRALRASGGKCAMTPRVRIGHIQETVTWPGDGFRPVHQYLNDYQREGRPEQCITW